MLELNYHYFQIGVDLSILRDGIRLIGIVDNVSRIEEEVVKLITAMRTTMPSHVISVNNAHLDNLVDSACPMREFHVICYDIMAYCM